MRSGPFPEQPCRLAAGPRRGGEQAGEWDLLQAGPDLPGRLAAWEQKAGSPRHEGSGLQPQMDSDEMLVEKHLQGLYRGL